MLTRALRFKKWFCFIDTITCNISTPNKNIKYLLSTHLSPVYPAMQFPGQLPLVWKHTSNPLQKPQWPLHPEPYRPLGHAVRNKNPKHDFKDDVKILSWSRTIYNYMKFLYFRWLPTGVAFNSHISIATCSRTVPVDVRTSIWLYTVTTLKCTSSAKHPICASCTNSWFHDTIKAEVPFNPCWLNQRNKCNHLSKTNVSDM